MIAMIAAGGEGDHTDDEPAAELGEVLPERHGVRDGLGGLPTVLEGPTTEGATGQFMLGSSSTSTLSAPSEPPTDRSRAPTTRAPCAAGVVVADDRLPHRGRLPARDRSTQCPWALSSTGRRPPDTTRAGPSQSRLRRRGCSRMSSPTRTTGRSRSPRRLARDCAGSSGGRACPGPGRPSAPLLRISSRILVSSRHAAPTWRATRATSRAPARSVR